jgi:hypothetical protein
MTITTRHGDSGEPLRDLPERPVEDWDAIAAARPPAPRLGRRSVLLATCLAVTAAIGVGLIVWLAPVASAAGGCGGG